MKDNYKVVDDKAALASMAKMLKEYQDVIDALANDDKNAFRKAEKSACFTGHRNLSESENSLSERLYALHLLPRPVTQKRHLADYRLCERERSESDKPVQVKNQNEKTSSPNHQV